MDDRMLIEKVSEGDLPAGRLLVEKYKNLVWHIIISMIGHNDDCEDLFQDVIYRVLKGCKKFRGDARLSTWIGSITHHVCVDYLRKRKKEFEFRNSDDAYQMVLSTSTDLTWASIEKNNLNKVVLETIAKLPATYRTVILLYHLDECSYSEIAEITGMPDGTVKSYINRGRNLLREALTTLIPDIVEILEDI